MPDRKIVFLFDGTWNNSIDYGGSKLAKKLGRQPLCTSELEQVQISDISTNIARLFHLIEHSNAQKFWYFRGVGTGDSLDSFKGGAFGNGADDRVEKAIELLNQHRNDGDEINIFGFSRGAAIARMFAREVPAYKPIKFMGLFDSVASFGMPDTDLSLNGFSKNFESFFEKLKIENRVEKVVHLVALDEDRQVFLPTLISRSPTCSPTRKEIWFEGNHGDIGGGWPDDKEPEKPFRRRQLSLRYMLEQDHGLKLIDRWKNSSDVLVDPERRNFGKTHGQNDYDFKSSWGGVQERRHVGKEFPIPYKPTREVIFLPEFLD